MTAKTERLMGLGQPGETASEITNQTVVSNLSYSYGSFTAVGTTLGSAVEMTALRGKVVPTATGQGITLPEVAAGDQDVLLIHNGGLTGGGSYDVKVYPDDALASINGGSAGVAILLGNGNGFVATKVAATDWQILKATRA